MQNHRLLEENDKLPDPVTSETSPHRTSLHFNKTLPPGGEVYKEYPSQAKSTLRRSIAHRCAITSVIEIHRESTVIGLVPTPTEKAPLH